MSTATTCSAAISAASSPPPALPPINSSAFAFDEARPQPWLYPPQKRSCHPEAQQGTCFLRGYIEANHEENRTDGHAFRQGTALAVPQSPETKHGFSR